MDNAIEFIKQENPDIVALQEVYNGSGTDLPKKYRSWEILKQSLGYPYTHFAPAFCEAKDFGQIDQGNAILSKFPVVGSKITFFDVPYGSRVESSGAYEFTPRNLQHVQLDLGSTRLNVFNTQGIWGRDGLDNKRRLAMAQIIAEELGNLQLTILAGDFNVFSNTQSIGFIENKLKNVFPDLKTSFNMQHKPKSFLPGVVDMVFISGDVSLKAQSCPQVNVSDHLPLLIEFETVPVMAKSVKL